MQEKKYRGLAWPQRFKESKECPGHLKHKIDGSFTLKNKELISGLMIISIGRFQFKGRFFNDEGKIEAILENGATKKPFTIKRKEGLRPIAEQWEGVIELEEKLSFYFFVLP